MLSEVNEVYGGMKPRSDVCEEMVEGGSGWPHDGQRRSEICVTGDAEVPQETQFLHDISAHLVHLVLVLFFFPF